MVVVGGGNPCGNLGFKWNENPRGKSGSFQSRVEMRGNFPQPCKHFNSPKIDNEWSLGYFHTLEPFLCHYITFWNFEGNRRKISMWEYPQGFNRIRRLKYPHRKFYFISPKFCRKIMRKFPQGWSLEIPYKKGRWMARWLGSLNFFVFLAAKWYDIRVNGWICMSGIYQQLRHQWADWTLHSVPWNCYSRCSLESECHPPEFRWKLSAKFTSWE